MGFNACFCWNLKDGCVTVGIWSLVFALASLGLFGWQFTVLNECRAVTMSQANLQCQIHCPCVGTSTTATSSMIEGLFIIQILCLIAAFFLLFASASLIYGIHTNSRYLVWPWFPCIVASMLCSVAYCVMWWSGDVRGYWLVLTILEIFSVLINVYCLICVIAQYRNIVAGRGEPSWYKQYDQPKDTVVYYDPKYQQNGYCDSRKDHQFQDAQYNTGYCDSSYEHERVHAPLGYRPPYGGYGYDYNAQHMADPLPPKTAPQDADTSGGAPFPQPLTEPPSPVKEEAPVLQHAQSVPSIQAETKHHRHSSRRHKHRHRAHSVGSRSRRSSKTYSSDSDDSDDDRRGRCRHCHKKRHRHHSRSRSRDRESDTDTGYSERSYRHSDRHRRHRHRNDDDEECDCEPKRRHHRRPRDVKRDNREKSTVPLVERPETSMTNNGSWLPKFPSTSAQGGLTIPQQIVIPPSSSANDKPQRYQINSEITISMPPGDGRRMKYGTQPRMAAPITANQRGQKMLTNGRSGAENGHQRHSSDSVGAGSSDSRGHGSTAV